MAEAIPTASRINEGEPLPQQKSETKTDETKPSATGKPPCIIVIGMAGSGKTTFVQVSHCAINQINGLKI